MEAVQPPLPISPFFTNHPTQPRRNQLHLPTIQRHSLPPRLPLRAQALNNALIDAAAAAAAASSTPSPGNLSVLIPISTVLLFVYWIANFVVPGMITKDLQPKASDGEEAPEPQANTSGPERNSKPSQRIKKRASKKMTTP